MTPQQGPSTLTAPPSVRTESREANRDKWRKIAARVDAWIAEGLRSDEISRRIQDAAREQGIVQGRPS